MGDVVNLRLARKARERALAEARAAENRAKFGRSKNEKQAARIDAERLGRSVDRAKRDTSDTKD